MIWSGGHATQASSLMLMTLSISGQYSDYTEIRTASTSRYSYMAYAKIKAGETATISVNTKLSGQYGVGYYILISD